MPPCRDTTSINSGLEGSSLERPSPMWKKMAMEQKCHVLGHCHGLFSCVDDLCSRADGGPVYRMCIALRWVCSGNAYLSPASKWVKVFYSDDSHMLACIPIQTVKNND